MTENDITRTVIEINNLYYSSDRDQEIFKDLSFSLKAGESAIIHGSAGSGKSSLLELIIGRSFADSGSVEVLGNLLKKRKKRVIRNIRRKIGGVGGLFSLIPNFTVAENIVYPLIVSGARSKVCKERLFTMLSEFSLINLANAYPGKLTRVENTLVQFARAAVAHQPLILVDEPLAGLDSNTYQRIYDYLAKLAMSGLSMVIVTSEELKTDLPNTKKLYIQNGNLV